ncbi:hypothetical protein FA95DRAFT_1612954 [Auriscalpium vulgare]|uniref:Uncharacterized protein n=1 Tax=Auriscalpium vulgare TaxID=40419 RepID=A0ACB8R4X6_9AGAM|nr:hypothetical protein FA95DRAFT_1612954 [Auriscalpium vulgare]
MSGEPTATSGNEHELLRDRVDIRLSRPARVQLMYTPLSSHGPSPLYVTFEAARQETAPAPQRSEVPSGANIRPPGAHMGTPMSAPAPCSSQESPTARGSQESPAASRSPATQTRDCPSTQGTRDRPAAPCQRKRTRGDAGLDLDDGTGSHATPEGADVEAAPRVQPRRPARRPRIQTMRAETEDASDAE